MDKMQNSKAIVTFDSRILWIRINPGAAISVNDVRDIYTFGMQKSNGAPFGILFDTTSHFEINEEVMEFVSSNPDNIPIKAKAYVVAPTDKPRIKQHLVFDQPLMAPMVFDTPREAINWLQSFL